MYRSCHEYLKKPAGDTVLSSAAFLTPVLDLSHLHDHPLPPTLLPRTSVQTICLYHDCSLRPLPSCLGHLFTIQSSCTVVLPALCPPAKDTSSPSCPHAQLSSPPSALLPRTPLHPPAFLHRYPPRPLPSCLGHFFTLLPSSTIVLSVLCPPA